MNQTVIGWLAVLGAGATAAGGTLAAGPLNKQTVIIASMAFLAACGSAARALYNTKPGDAIPPAQKKDGAA
jgi:hypothetical protein